MKNITIEELINIINNIENKKLDIILEGIITMEVKREIEKIIKKENDIEILYKQTEEKIKFNFHQIMKIELITDKEIMIYFDCPQTIKIRTNNTILNY